MTLRRPLFRQVRESRISNFLLGQFALHRISNFNSIAIGRFLDDQRV